MSARSHAEEEIKRLAESASAMQAARAELALIAIHWPRPAYTDEAETLKQSIAWLTEQLDELVGDFLFSTTVAARARAQDVDADVRPLDEVLE